MIINYVDKQFMKSLVYSIHTMILFVTWKSEYWEISECEVITSRHQLVIDNLSFSFLFLSNRDTCKKLKRVTFFRGNKTYRNSFYSLTEEKLLINKTTTYCMCL